MEEHETEYDQEVLGDPDSTEQEGSGSEEPELEETDQEETDQGEGQEETEKEQTGSETGGTEESLEGETGEEPAEESQEETVSGNDIVIKGNVVVFPEGYESVMSESESTQADTETIVKAIESQSDNMTAGFGCTCFMLGVLAGSMVISGFRLRRV